RWACRFGAGLRPPARDLQCHRRIGGTTLRVGSAAARDVCVADRCRAGKLAAVGADAAGAEEETAIRLDHPVHGARSTDRPVHADATDLARIGDAVLHVGAIRAGWDWSLGHRLHGARHIARRRASRQGPAYSTTPPTTVAAMGTSGSSSTATSSTSRSNTVRSAS